MVDRMEKIIAAGEADYEAVRMQEREKVVAWLRKDAAMLKADIAKGCWEGDEYRAVCIVGTIIYCADAIESGHHLKENDNA